MSRRHCMRRGGGTEMRRGLLGLRDEAMLLQHTAIHTPSDRKGAKAGLEAQARHITSKSVFYRKHYRWERQ